MKKILLVTLAAMMLASVSFAAWTPNPMVITVEDEIYYAFDASSLEIPVTVSGKAGKGWLWINTKLADDEKPIELQNGKRGWHYVNDIDTTVYISGAIDLTVGSENAFVWDGMGSENTAEVYGGTIESTGVEVEPGKYDYCVFGYDDKNGREIVCNYICISFYWKPQFTKIGEWNDDGTPRANPYLWGNTANGYTNLHAQTSGGEIIGPREGWLSYGPPAYTAYKFPIGSDPDDMAAVQTTFMTGFAYNAGEDNRYHAPVVFDPDDEMTFYTFMENPTDQIGTVNKWTWVTAGDAVKDPDWGGWDNIELQTQTQSNDFSTYEAGTATDGKYMFISTPGKDPSAKWDKFYVIDWDGEEVGATQLDPFYDTESTNKNGAVNRLYANLDSPNQAVMGGEQHCLTMMVHTDRIADGDESYVKWWNGNGDYFLDASWDEAETPAEQLWQCNQGNYKTPNMGRHDEQWFDSNGVTIVHPDFHGLTSIVVYTQDGSGVAYAHFADDTISVSTNAGDKKGSGQRCDNGTIYDGIYTGFVLYEGSGYGSGPQRVTWFGMDSAMGMITDDKVGVEEEAQASFSVDAAYPNPANPTTTIGFTLAEAGHVSVDIFNVAGQKVDTLVNGEMSIGSHSVTWDASQFAAGVYFYTVKSGNFSKTMKVTLLK